MAVQVETEFIGNPNIAGGVLARCSDSSNWLRAAGSAYLGSPVPGYNQKAIFLWKRVAGVATFIGGWFVPGTTLNSPATVRLVVIGDRWEVWGAVRGTSVKLLAIGTDSALASGGALASGRGGLYDVSISGLAQRRYDNFMAFTPTPADAVIYANQSVSIYSDRAEREDSSGTVSADVADPQGKFLTYPPAGLEGRQLRIFVKASRNDPDLGPDSGIDDISAQLTYTPRYLVIPSS